MSSAPVSSADLPAEPMRRGRDRTGWRSFALAMLILSVAMFIALFSAAASRQGRVGVAAIATTISLAMAGYVAVTIVPALARRSSLRWLAYQVDYRLTRAGIVYLAAVFILVLAAVNTGNNLLFLILACMLAAILISGVLSRAMLAGITLRFAMPGHIFAGQPVLAEVELQNQKRMLPSFSLLVTGGSRDVAAAILSRPVFFPYLGPLGSAQQKVELCFAHRGLYRQSSFGVRTRFPFGFFEKTRLVGAAAEIVVYPRVEPAAQFYEVLPLLSGEIASQFRGRGHELHSLRDYLPSDSARFVDWKVTAKSDRLMVREFAREDERRVMLVFDPCLGATHGAGSGPGSPEFAGQFERAVALAASIAWHFYEIHSVLQFRTPSFSTRMAPAGEIIYSALRELALIQPDTAASGDTFFGELAAEPEIFKIVFTARPRQGVPGALWSSSYFLFISEL